MLVILFGLLFLAGSLWMLWNAWLDFKSGHGRTGGILRRRVFRRDDNAVGFWTAITTNTVLGIVYLTAGLLIITLSQ